jgi:hypothetical protein
VSDRDPDLQFAIDVAAQELARRLRPWVAGMADLDSFAVRFVEDMHGQGWRPIPKPPPLATGRPGDPPNTEWRQARQALTQTTDGDTDA